MSDDSNDNGWGDPAEEAELSLKSIPKNWSGYTRAQKVQKQASVIQHQMARVLRGSFNLVDSPRVAAMILDAQMEMAPFIADAEAFSIHAKHASDFTEADTITRISKEFISEGKKASEAALKRMATVSEEVKEARKTMVEANREYKRWRGIHDMLSSAHVFFRNLPKT